MDLAKLIDQAQCPRLNEKYKGIAALPLDLPKFELDNEEEFWKTIDNFTNYDISTFGNIRNNKTNK